MRSLLRVPFLALLVSAVVVVAGPAAAQAASSFGLESVFAANCTNKTCGELEIPSLQPKEVKNSELYTQAAGHPVGGITQFKVKTEGTFPNAVPSGILTGGVVTHVRTDVGLGVSTNPEAVGKCSMKEFGETEVSHGVFLPPECKPESIIGVNQVIVALFTPKHEFVTDVPLEGEVYNLEQPNGRASDFGVALELPESITGHKGLVAHTMIEGGVEWGREASGTEQGDYHDYYEINVSPELPLISSRLILEGERGTTGKGGFITNPSHCWGTGAQTITTVTLTPAVGSQSREGYGGALGTEGCNGASPFLEVPFKPAFKLTPETTQSDKPDGITTELELPHNPGSSKTDIDTSQLRNAEVKLPEGFSMNPSAAGEVKEACTPAQARIHSSTFGVACPEGSKLGAVTIEVPTLPAKSLTGDIYLGGPEGGGPITAPPYTMYLNAESKRYGVDVRLQGTVTPNPTTGQLTATFNENPEQPFSNAILEFNHGELAPIANPLVCGTATTTTSLVPYIGSFATESPSWPVAIDSNNKGGPCSSPPPFSLSQSVFNQPPGYAGAKTSYTLNIGRSDGQQYLSQIKTVLPEGLVGLLPTVTKCPEPQASKGECPSTSQIGVVNVAAGSGHPYGFRGPVYLTGPYGGAPFGMSVVVPAVAGPFNLGNVVTRGTINIEPYTARVVATSNMPTIVGGIPLRLRGVSIEINKQGFLQNPTNCGVLATETTLTGIASLQPGAPTTTQTLSTPFQVNNCSALAFKPSTGAATGAKTSKANGASLETTINVPSGNANTKSVVVQLPKQLPSRLTTLQKACPEATFASNPYHCPSGSFVGGARANTPTLATKLNGPAILVSHGGRAFPDLDLLLEAEGVKVILVGNTQIKNGVTTTTFASPPDAPVTSITVNLPTGAHSALAANGNLCTSKLVMPTTIVGQNGTTFKQSTTIKVRNCPVQVVGRKTAGNTAYLTVRTYEPGRISGKGSDLATTFRTLKQAQKSASLKVPLSSAGKHRGRPFYTKVRVGFVPKKKGQPTSVTYVTVRFG